MTMIRQHKKMILLTSIITLFPIFIGLLLWNQLPDSLATHWGINNEPNGYASKTFAVFGLPLIMLLGHAVSVIAMNIDPKVKNISEKVYFVILYSDFPGRSSNHRRSEFCPEIIQSGLTADETCNRYSLYH